MNTRIYFSHGMIFIYDSAERSPGNAWTDFTRQEPCRPIRAVRGFGDAPYTIVGRRSDIADGRLAFALVENAINRPSERFLRFGTASTESTLRKSPIGGCGLRPTNDPSHTFASGVFEE